MKKFDLVMDHVIHESLHHKDEDEKVEPGQLLEECWFFGNFFDRKQKMSRSFSDPCTSSNYRQEILSGKTYEETYESIKKLDKLSKPTCMDRKVQNLTTKLGSDDGIRRKSMRKASSNNLLRAPSLPTSLGAEEYFQDEEIEFSMGNLIRQASLNNSDNYMPPRTVLHAAKVISPSSSLSRHRPTTPGPESLKLEGLEKIRPKPQRSTNQLKTQKSLNDLEYEELQGFKDLGFDFNKKDLNPIVINIIPGLQEKKRNNEDQEKNRRRPYLSEAWQAQNYAPPVPKSSGKKSPEDVKAQIKYWARVVASNVRQEC